MTFHGVVLLFAGYQADEARTLRTYKVIVDVGSLTLSDVPFANAAFAMLAKNGTRFPECDWLPDGLDGNKIGARRPADTPY
ncbi:hypothetical protein K438DRAFT_1961525 [Mycena galopus ATCC 62051]|nr:hypothetical protein K438DRAFT_1961525 [Mycena galopus ATCC 62051]